MTVLQIFVDSYQIPPEFSLLQANHPSFCNCFLYEQGQGEKKIKRLESTFLASSHIQLILTFNFAFLYHICSYCTISQFCSFLQGMLCLCLHIDQTYYEEGTVFTISFIIRCIMQHSNCSINSQEKKEQQSTNNRYTDICWQSTDNSYILFHIHSKLPKYPFSPPCSLHAPNNHKFIS